jgi:hypothetical protein
MVFSMMAMFCLSTWVLMVVGCIVVWTGDCIRWVIGHIAGSKPQATCDDSQETIKIKSEPGRLSAS